MSLKSVVRFAFALTWALFLFAALAPAAQAQVSGKPLTKDEIVGLLRSQASPKDVARPAHEFGINFAMTPQIEAEIRQAGADQPTADMDALIRVLRGMAFGRVDILGLVVETESSEYLARLIRRRGIDFGVSEDFLKQLRDAGGEKSLEDALRLATVVSNPRSTVAQQLEAQLVQHVYRGSQFEKKHEFDKAETEYRAALIMEKQNPVLQMVLGHLLLLEGKKDESEAEFRAALRLWPSSPPAHSNIGVSLFVKGSLDAAIAEQRAAILRDPDYADGHGNLGTELVQKGDFDAGVAELREALRIDPERVIWRIQLDAALATHDRLDEAIADLREVIRLKSDDARAHMVLGQAFSRKEDWDQAITEEKAALSVDPNLAAAHVNLGHALLMKKDFDQALSELRAAVRLDADLVSAHLELGLALDAKKDLDQAISEYRAAVQVGPNAAAAHFLLGLALERKKDLQGALDELAKAKQLDPKEASRIQPAIDRVQVALQSGSSQTAAAPSADPDLITDDDLDELHAAQALVNARRTDEAIAKLQDLIRRKPNYADAHMQLGLAFGLKKDQEKDIAEERAALRLNPTLAQAHLELGIALTWKGDWDQALSELRAAVQLAPADPRARFNLANVLNHQKDLAGALDEYSKAKELDPQNKEYVNAYTELQKTVDSNKRAAANSELRVAGVYFSQDKEELSKAITSQTWGALNGVKDFQSGKQVELMVVLKGYKPQSKEITLNAFCEILDPRGKRSLVYCAGGTPDTSNFIPPEVVVLTGSFGAPKEPDGAYTVNVEIRDIGRDYNQGYPWATGTRQLNVVPPPRGAQSTDKTEAEATATRAAPGSDASAASASSQTAALRTEPDAAARRHLQSALDYLTKNDLETALSEAKAAVQAAPNSGEVHHLLGEVYERRNDPQTALDEYSLARQLDPKDSTIQIAYDRVQNALAHPNASGAGSGTTSAESSASAGPENLEGIYVAREGTGNAHWYYFQPSGAVALECDQFLGDPSQALSWPTMSVSVDNQAAQRGYRPVACSLGQYEFQGNQIRFNVYAFLVDFAQRVKFRVTGYRQDDRRGVEGLQTLKGFDVVKLVRPVSATYSPSWVLYRQPDQTGRTLDGTFSNLVLPGSVGTYNTGQTGDARFTPDGQFAVSVQTSWEGNAGAQPKPGGRTGTGTYEIQGHTIFFHNADGTTSVRNFGYLGKDERGREFIAIGGFLWVTGNILSE